VKLSPDPVQVSEHLSPAAHAQSESWSLGRLWGPIPRSFQVSSPLLRIGNSAAFHLRISGMNHRDSEEGVSHPKKRDAEKQFCKQD